MKKIAYFCLFILVSCIPAVNSDKICDKKSKGFLIATIFFSQRNEAYCYTNSIQRNNSQNPINISTPITYKYERETNVFLNNIPIRNQTPAVTGTILSYSVTPSLPAGLVLNSTTGIIAGTPTSQTPEVNYTFTATGGNNVTQTFQMKIRIGGTTAIRVYGQLGSFTTGILNNGGITANTLSGPIGVSGDSTGGIYIGDTVNNRFLYYPKGTTTATRVYGQYGDFNCGEANVIFGGCSGGGTATANTINSSFNAFSGLNNILYLADKNNNRVLSFAGNSIVPSGVFGQANLTSSVVTTSANGLSGPEDIVQDPSGGIYIADRGNNRVLYYTAGSTTATRVYGQFGNFTCITHSANNNGACTVTPRPISANSLNNPVALALDSLGGLFVVDSSNSRVLHYPKDITTADRVYGQSGSFTTSAVPAPNANSLNLPAGIAVDAFDNVYISDTVNHRILFYQGTSTTATRVYGQSGNFTTASITLSANGLQGPARIYLDVDGSLYVTDENHHRVLMY